MYECVHPDPSSHCPDVSNGGQSDQGRRRRSLACAIWPFLEVASQKKNRRRRLHEGMCPLSWWWWWWWWWGFGECSQSPSFMSPVVPELGFIFRSDWSSQGSSVLARGCRDGCIRSRSDSERWLLLVQLIMRLKSERENTKKESV